MLLLKLAEDARPMAIGDGPHVVLVQETAPEAEEAHDAGLPAAGDEPLHEATLDEGHAESGGMPQLNFADFPPQLVWLAITFILLLILMSRVALPRIAQVIEQRDARIKGDIDRAERVKAEADAALAAYQKTMADARAKAQAELRQGQAAIAAETAKREAAFVQRLAERTKAAEDSIAAAKSRALADLRGVGIEVTGSVLGKLAGLSLPAERVQAAVDEAMTER
jgi:F-type H+-transporting ATPase subunit b